MLQICNLPFKKVTSLELLQLRQDEMEDIEDDVEEIFFITQDDDIINMEDSIVIAHHDMENEVETKSRWNKGSFLISSTIFLVGSILLIVLI